MNKLFFNFAVASLILSSCGAEPRENVADLVRVEGNSIPKAVIYKEDDLGNVEAYALYDDDLNFLTVEDFEKMKDDDVEKIISRLTEKTNLKLSSQKVIFLPMK